MMEKQRTRVFRVSKNFWLSGNNEKVRRQRQVAALKHYIMRAPQGSEFAKKLLFLMLDHSDLLTRRVNARLVAGEGYCLEEARSEIHTIKNMWTSGFETRLDVAFAMVGTDAFLRTQPSDWGALVSIDFRRDNVPTEELQPQRFEVERVNLYLPGLYSQSEPEEPRSHQIPSHLGGKAAT